LIHPAHFFKKYKIEPKKSLGQNFLFDENILSRIVEAAVLSPDDQVLEIGPGVGTLTRLLAQKAAAVVAVELDDRLIPILRSEINELENVRLIHGDILEFNSALWFQQSYKVVANVPYYITGAILRHLLSTELKPTVIVLTVQKEVADRITAAPPDMSLLAVSVQFYGMVEIVDIVKAGAFWPKPDVDSAVIRIDLQEQEKSGTRILSSENEDFFFQVVKAGFSQKRKQLKNNLRGLGYSKEELTSMLRRAGIDGRRRPQTLKLEEWQELVMAAMVHSRN